MMNLHDLSKTLLLLITCGHLAAAQNNGDLRLISAPQSVLKGAGRLEIYLDGKWGTFCATGFNSFIGDAACHQLGYENSIDIRRASNLTDHIPLASNSTPIHVTMGFNDCRQNYFDTFVMHILRCFPTGFNQQVDPLCMHDSDVILTCFSSPLELDGYDTQIRLNSEALNSTYQSSGVLEIYTSTSHGEEFWGWRNICGSKFDQNAANTACRQLGYTRALSYETSAIRSRDEDIWLDGVTCGNYSHSCLDICFCYPQPLTAVQCQHGGVVALSCTFDLGEADFVNFPGTRLRCEEEKKTFCALPTSDTTTTIILGTVLSSAVVILFLVIVGLLMMMWYRSGRTGYQAIN